MRKTLGRPRVIFPEGFDERAAFETPLKGWLSAQVELEDSCRYTVYFSDPVRLQQDLDEAVKSGKPCFAEPGLIIVPEVTVETVQNTVLFLWKQGFFASLQANQGRGWDSVTTAPNHGMQPTRKKLRAADASR